jgi:hypothetical protein
MDHTCVTIDGVGVCDEVRDPVGSFCARTVFNCAEACIFTVTAATEGYCSTRCEGDDDCGAGFACGIPETAFLYDDPSVADERLCLRAAEPVDTGVVVDSGVITAEDTGGDESEGGTPATETGHPPSGGDTAASVKASPAKRGCGCTATEKGAGHRLWLWVCLPLLVLTRTKGSK